MEGVHIEECPICSSSVLTEFMTVKDHSISGEEFKLIRCDGCGLRITQDHPDANSIGPYYASEDYVSHSNTSKGLINGLYQRVRKYMLGQKQKLVEKYQRPGHLLDIGAGTGHFLNQMKVAGWAVTGLEPDEGARAIAKRDLSIDLRDLSQMTSLTGKTFDVITMWHVMEHVHDLQGQMSELKRLLKTQGTLIIAVPNPLSSDAEHYGNDWAAYDVPRHLWHFSPDSMKRLLETHGFELVEERGMPFDAFYVSLLSEKYRGNGLGPLSGGISGLVTNLKALGRTDRSSSIIYVSKSA